MEHSKQARSKPLTTGDVQERGRALQHRFRVAGLPQYTRWYQEQDGKLVGDASRIQRINVLFNGRGSMQDVELLEYCEALADQHLDQPSLEKRARA